MLGRTAIEVIKIVPRVIVYHLRRSDSLVRKAVIAGSPSQATSSVVVSWLGDH
ncbi:hypothetical protein J6590_070453 [Homalodisca vitripennis]|nr:hypothetical protein J6590_070453 [Homalodisca vitripennis]